MERLRRLLLLRVQTNRTPEALDVGEYLRGERPATLSVTVVLSRRFALGYCGKMAASVLNINSICFGYAGTPFRLTLERFDVEEGERVAIIGPSGCGKTTLLELACGIRLPDSGTVHCLGKNLATQSEQHRRALRLSSIGLVFQEFRLLDYLPIERSILLPSELHASRDPAAANRLHDLAKRAGIESLLRRRPARLSQGERQRAAICRALITNPQLVLADEPTGNLDPDSAGRVMDLLHDCCTHAGAALCMVTHDHTLLERFDRVLDLGNLEPAA